MLNSQDMAAISAFSESPTLAGEVFLLLSGAFPSPFNEQDIALKLGYAAGQETGILQCLRLAETIGLINSSGSGWQLRVKREVLSRLSLILESNGYFKSAAHQDENLVSVVLTRPGQPSRLETELENLGWKTASLELTEEAFISLATNAKERFVIMTPFLDAVGANWVLALFNKTRPEVKRTLILRYLNMPSHPSYPTGYDLICEELSKLEVKIYDYAVEKSDAPGYETFHAKVILADRSTAYVGSSNMNKASKERSMEMGLVVKGRAAQQISRVLESIMRIAN